MLKPILLCSFILALSSWAFISSEQTKEYFPFRKYNQSDGLTSYNITKILQDRNGFIWISTQDGLNCFDGKRFLTFDQQKDNRHQLNGNTIMDMTEDRTRGLIWLVTSYGGLQCIDINTRTIVLSDLARQINRTIAGKWMHSVAVTHDLLWIGTYSGLYRYDLGSHSFLPPDTSLDRLRTGKLLPDSAGHLWAFCDGQDILALDGKTGRLLTRLAGNVLNSYHSAKDLLFWNVTLLAHNELLACTNWGLRHLVLRSSGLIELKPPSEFPVAIAQHETFSCATDTGRTIWVADAHSLYRLDPATHRFSSVSERDDGNDAWLTAIYALHIDNAHRIWVGSEEGLSYFTPQRPAFEKFYRSHTRDTKIQHAFSICPENDTVILCGAANGLYQVNTSSNSIRQLHPGPSCYLVSRLNADQFVVSNSQGLWICRSDGSMSPADKVYPELQRLTADLFCAMVRYSDSIVLLGSELRKGLYVWNTKKRTIVVYNADSGLPLDDGLINAICTDHAGNAWILSVNSVTRFDPMTGVSANFRLNDPFSGHSCNILFDMCETRNSYWFAAYGMGLIETDKQLSVRHVYSQKDGLCNNGVYKTFASGDSMILVTSNDGLSVLNTADHRIYNYFEPDGLHSNAFEQFCGSSKNGLIYAGGVNGFTRIFPRYIFSNPDPPKLFITDIRMDASSGSHDTTDLKLTQLDVPSEIYQTTVHFTGLNLRDPLRTTYVYRIPELSGSWTNLGIQNSISLLGLNPGKYTLEIKAANEHGVLTPTPVTLTLHFLPKWHQTLWFKVTILTMIAFLPFALYRYRISELKKQQQIRRDIAGDLHDDLGSTLNTVKILTHLAKRDPGRNEHLDKIEESLTTASIGLRDMIWVLDDSADTLVGLSERICKTILPVLTAKDIHLNCSTEAGSENQRLTKAEKRNFLLITKEAVNNSVKYAECTKINILLFTNGTRIGLSIFDDGKGFEPKAPSCSSGNGLSNIHYRAKQINCVAFIRSSPGEGTFIEVVQK